jgi:hypothetical protein
MLWSYPFYIEILEQRDVSAAPLAPQKSPPFSLYHHANHFHHDPDHFAICKACA